VDCRVALLLAVTEGWGWGERKVIFVDSSLGRIWVKPVAIVGWLGIDVGSVFWESTWIDLVDFYR
jgi:hypothetical protein